MSKSKTYNGKKIKKYPSINPAAGTEQQRRRITYTNIFIIVILYLTRLYRIMIPMKYNYAFFKFIQ